MTSLKVERPGLFTTLQDQGRPGCRHWGIAPGGAVDSFAAAAANWLVGNSSSAPVLECTQEGPVLRADGPVVVAVTGAKVSPLVNGRPAPLWESFFVAPGDDLSLGRAGWGLRAYVSVAGGFEAERWLGSRSTCLAAHRGGLQGRALRSGDELQIGPVAQTPATGRSLEVDQAKVYGSGPIRVMAGPHMDWLDAPGRAHLLGGEYMVSPHCDRMGCRLEGPHLTLPELELLSFGVTSGCIQVPGSGQPILLLVDHQSTGGYPVPATVIRADLPRAAQLAPGDRVSLREVNVGEAMEAWRFQRELIPNP